MDPEVLISAVAQSLSDNKSLQSPAKVRLNPLGKIPQELTGYLAVGAWGVRLMELDLALVLNSEGHC